MGCIVPHKSMPNASVVVPLVTSSLYNDNMVSPVEAASATNVLERLPISRDDHVSVINCPLPHSNTNRDHLADALDRCAQFFVAPLFTPSATERELQAVNAEHSKNLQNDALRLY
ncbi:hypothetical protein PsorP6_000047 [Peronosclerospora sorghi]|uniref:Uncharacterized protein n=1 Tax=Peronosclerospora sorghi TaxID=230839 RepID=A0ACC0WQ30_9STRA|nr:hypothetical protein PsorP6_000047 [Peronosclerospora sorghi]